LIAGTAVANGFEVVVAVHIDHWFGERWLGFCGKLLGAAGVRNRRLTSGLVCPPFHPNRVRSARQYRFDGGRFEFCEDVGALHRYRPSEQNLNNTLRRGRLYAWYSGDTATTDKAAVMVYLVQRKWSTAWYAGFDKAPQWHLAKTVSIAPHRVLALLNWAGSGAASEAAG
jgi:hypothetical protein